MAWFYLTTSGLFEIGWAIGLKYTDGFTDFAPVCSDWSPWPRVLSFSPRR